MSWKATEYVKEIRSGVELTPRGGVKRGPSPQTKPEVFRIPVSTGILSHSKRMRDAIWLFLYFIDKTTQEVPDEQGDKVGLILGGKPVCDKEAAEVLGRSVRTVRRWRGHLAKLGYISQKRTPIGYVIRVQRSQKWTWRERADSSNTSECPNLPAKRDHIQ